MARFNKRKNAVELSGDLEKRRRARKRSWLFLRERQEKGLFESDEVAIKMLQSRPDMIFTVLCVLLISLGTVLSFSAGAAYASQAYGDGFHFVKSHILHLAVGFVVAAIFYVASHPRWLRILSVGFYLGSILLLVLVLIIGVEGGGAKRWLSLGSFTLQPSELAKTGIILLMSLYMTRYDESINSGFNRYSLFHGLLAPSFIFLFVCVLIFFEHHFSGIIITAAIGVGMLFIGGTYLGWFAILVPFVPLVGILIYNSEYAMKRINSFLDKGSENLVENWQSTQGLYAISSGGLFGVGIGESSLKYGYVSQPQNDFVFTIVCEELGFFGATAIMLLFLALVIRGVILGLRAPDKYISLVILGLSFKLAIHVILNVGVVSGVLPNTGISLPFFSSGGSATISQMIDMGIVLGLSRFCTQKQ